VAKRSPILGYNHNVRYRGLVFHVQTEDSGVLSPHLFTHLFFGGTIISTRKLVYDAGSAEDAIKALMQAQHKAVMKDLKYGAFDDKIDQYLAGTEGLERRTSPVGTTAATRPNKRELTPLPGDATERATTDVDTSEAIARARLGDDDDLTTPIELSLEPQVGHAPTVQVHAPTIEVTPPASDTEPVVAKSRTKTADRGSRGSSVRFKPSAPPLPPPPEPEDAPTFNDDAGSVAAAVQAANRVSTSQGRAQPPPIPSRTATPPPIPQRAHRPLLDSEPEISIELEADDEGRLRSPRDTAVESFDPMSDSDGVPRQPDRARTASQNAATLPPARKPSRPAISPPTVMSRQLPNNDDKSGAVEIYAPAPSSVEPPPGERRDSERPGQYSVNRRNSEAPIREQTGKMAPLSKSEPIPAGLGRPRSPSADRPASGSVRVPQPTPAGAVPQAIGGKEGTPGSRSPNVTAPIASRSANPSSGVVMTRPAVIVGAPPKGAAQTPPRVRKAREDEGRGFGQGLISEKSLDEVILAYLSEDSEDK
jgi:hypothetical protein